MSGSEQQTGVSISPLPHTGPATLMPVADRGLRNPGKEITEQVGNRDSVPGAPWGALVMGKEHLGVLRLNYPLLFTALGSGWSCFFGSLQSQTPGRRVFAVLWFLTV